ncbi:hypothetical protein HMI49_20590, partial [Corallococcus exercitus]
LLVWLAVGAAVVLLVRMFLPRVGVAAQWMLLVPVLVVLGQFVACLLAFFVPVASRMALGVTFGPVIAGLVGLGSVAAMWLGAGPLMASGAPRRVLGAAVCVGGAGCLALALLPVYDAEHPKRIRAEWQEGLERERWFLVDEDNLPLQSALRGVACAEVPAGWRGDEACETGVARAPAEVPPGVRVVSAREAAGGRRTVTLEVEAQGAFAMDVSVPVASVAAWTSPLPALYSPDDPYTVRVLAPPVDGWTTTLTLQGQGPVPVLVERRYLPTEAQQAGVEAMVQPWTTADLVVVKAVRAWVP